MIVAREIAAAKPSFRPPDVIAAFSVLEETCELALCISECQTATKYENLDMNVYRYALAE